MRKNKILSVIGGLAAFIFTSCDGIFDVDYYTFCPKIIYLPMNLLLRRGYWDVTNCFIRIVSEEVRGGTSSYDACELTYFRCTSFRMGF